MQKKRFSKYGGLFFAFNFIVGYAFVVGLGQSFLTSGIVGFPIILAICAVIAYGVGLAFANLSAKFQGYGGSYLYTKNGIGKNVSFWIGWFQYIQAPFVAISSVAGIVWAFQNANFFGWDLNTPQAFNDAKPWLFIGAGSLFVVLIAVVNFGFNTTRFSLWFMWGLKWLILGSSLLFAFAEIIKLGATGHGQQIIDNFTGKGFHQKISFWDLITSVLTFFFAFGGFEGIAAISDDIEDPKKNLKWVLIVVIIVATIFYLVYYFAFIGALGADQSSASSIIPNGAADGNPINTVIKQVLGAGTGIFLAIGSIGIVSQVANKSTSRVQNPWVNTRLLLPLAVDGWIPKWFTHVNKHGQFNRCLMFDSCLTGVLVLTYSLLCIFATKDVANNLANTLGIYTIVAFLNYIGAICAILNLWRKKLMECSKFEIAMYLFSLGAILLILVGFIGQGIFYWTSEGIGSPDFKQFAFQFIGLIISVFLGLVIFICSKKLGWQNQKLDPSFVEYLKHNPESVDESVLKTLDDYKHHDHIPAVEIVNT
ncbi:MAG: APC family permease [Mycoplasma sp.]